MRGRENIVFCNFCLLLFLRFFPLVLLFSLSLAYCILSLFPLARKSLMVQCMDIIKTEKSFKDGRGNRAFLPACSYFSSFLPLFFALTSLVFSFTSNDFRLMIVEVQITVLLQITSSRFVIFTTFQTDGFLHSRFFQITFDLLMDPSAT